MVPSAGQPERLAQERLREVRFLRFDKLEALGLRRGRPSR